MIVTILYIIIELLLVIMVYQDFNQRKVSFMIFPAIIIMQISIKLMNQPIAEYLKHVSLNLFVFLILVLTIGLYLKIRGRKINKQVGAADLLFLLFFAVALPVGNAIMIMTAGAIVALLGFYLINLIRPGTWQTIPLAGIWAMVMIIVISYSLIFQPVIIDKPLFHGF